MLLLPDASAARMNAMAEAGYPQEVCGLLVGVSAEGTREVREVHPAENLNRERAADRYDLNPVDYVRIERAAAVRGLAVVGVYHSHPDHPSRPSETDRARAAEIWGPAESWSYVILEVTRGKVASRRSWVLKDEAFSEEAVRPGKGAA